MQHSTRLPNKVQALAKAQGALLGAAVGDALGWPQEFPRKQVGRKSQKPSPSIEFQSWKRRAGGQYRSYVEVIQPGEYSDDTQLLLCTARSLLYSKQWWEHLTKRELPTWIKYERGGGGATLRSVRSWVKGQSPWSNLKLQQQYFDAGGNGVAMRILPHCLLGMLDSDFNKVAHGIVANGVTTHGHPRALVGALGYGFALWTALREIEPLSYGELVDVLLAEVAVWSQFPNVDEICPGWEMAARETLNDQYKKQWQATVDEMQELLEQSQVGMSQGALSIDRELLRQLGCFSKEKGSGTITSTAAIFLASRYAADPSHGLLEAAFAHGADTDTLASMTGALLGAIVGFEWLEHSAEEVQDTKYFKAIGQRLIAKDTLGHCDNSNIEENKISSIELFDQLEQFQLGDRVVLPDGRESEIQGTYSHPSSSKAAYARSWKLKTSDGQTVYVKKIWNDKVESKSRAFYQNAPEPNSKSPSEHQLKKSTYQAAPRFDLDADLLPVKPVNSSVRLLVDNLDESRFFYGKVLGLTCSKESNNLVKYGNIWLMEVPKEYASDTVNSSAQQIPSQDMNPSVWVEVESLENVYQNICRVGLQIVKSISERDKARYFICRDPSEHLVVVNEIPF